MVLRCPKCNAELRVDDRELAPPKKKSWAVPLIVGLCVLMLCCGMGVVATLVGLLVPVVQKVREAANRTQTLNNLSQCAKATHLAHDLYKKFPPYFGVYGPPEEKRAMSFHTHLLPFVDQMALYQQPTPNPNAPVPAFLSTMDPTHTGGGAGAANFPVNLRLYYTHGGMGELSSGDKLIYPKLGGMPDGTSNTLLFATKYHHCGANGGSFWADSNALDSPTAATFGKSMSLWQKAPPQATCDPLAGTAVSFTVQTIQVAMCDGSVRNVSFNVSPATWQAAHTYGAADNVGQDLWDK
jgi:hypothetical protein